SVGMHPRSARGSEGCARASRGKASRVLLPRREHLERVVVRRLAREMPTSETDAFADGLDRRALGLRETLEELPLELVQRLKRFSERANEHALAGLAAAML